MIYFFWLRWVSAPVKRARREWSDKRKLARLTGDERDRFLNLLWLEDEMSYTGPKDAPRVEKSALRRWFAA